MIIDCGYPHTASASAYFTSKYFKDFLNCFLEFYAKQVFGVQPITSFSEKFSNVAGIVMQIFYLVVTSHS